jgi:hypothetical protein
VTELRDENTKETTSIWPRVSWWGWKTPTGATWNFGQVTVSSNAPITVESHALNWNASVRLLSR